MSTNRRILNLPLITSGNVTGSIVLPLDDPSDNLTKKINLNQVKDFVLSGSVDNNYYTTGSTLINGIVYFNRNDQLSAYTLNLTSLTGDANTYLTAVTYNQSTNTITLTDNTNTNFNAYINSVSGLTVNGVLSATTISATTLYGDGSNLTGISSGTNLSKTLFVDPNGNDSTAVKGDLHKPYQNIYAAKSAATSGDTIYVLPGTWTYDNSNANGNFWNNKQSQMNLWKNGITYYFSAGAKIVVYNQTDTGQDLYMIKPNGNQFETCTILGHLDYEQNGVGPNNSIGRISFFDGSTIGAESGYTFYCEARNLVAYTSELYRIERPSVVIPSDSVVSKITVIAESETYSYVAGQSGSDAICAINIGDSPMDIKLYAKYRNCSGRFGYSLRGTFLRSKLNIYGEELYCSGNNIFRNRIQSGTINVNIDTIYYNSGYSPFALFGSVVSADNSGGFTMNIKSNLIDYAPNTQTSGIFYLSTANNTINFDGNIITNTTGGTGRFIAATTTSGNIININGDIQLIGTGTTTNVLFQPNGNSTINYRGKISGNYTGPIVKTYNGTVNINNSFITTTTGGTSLQLVQNGATSLGVCRINNSHITLSNDSNPIIAGNYVKTLINNSTIINSGSGLTASNSVSSGSLQSLNSTLVTASSTGNTINYTSTSPVISSNTTVNGNYNITDLKGDITILTDLIF